MTWFVKGRDQDGTVHPVLADDPDKVADLYQAHKDAGRETWIEDTVGKMVEPKVFGIKEGSE